MIRGTTTGFKFKLPYNYSDLVRVRITFWQPDNDGPSLDRPLPILKVLKHCNSTENPKELSVCLCQEETLRFTERRKAYVQIKGATIDGITFASKKHMFTVYPVYDDSILDIDPMPTPDPDEWYIFDGGIVV